MAYGSIYKQYNGKYRVCFDFGIDKNGKRIRHYKTFPSRQEANRALNAHKVSVDNRCCVRPQNTTVSEWMSYWMENVIALSGAQTTIYSYNHIIRMHINPVLGGIKLQMLKSSDIQEYMSHLINVKRLSPNTAIKHADILSNALGVAVRHEMILKNPMDAVCLPKRVQSEATVYTGEQLAELLARLCGHPIEVPVMLAVYYGLRRGEITGLRWQDVDFERRVLYIRNTRTSAGNSIIEKTTKNPSSIRKLAIPERIFDLLSEEYERQSAITESSTSPGVYVCIMRNGQPYRPNYLSESFSNFLRQNGLPKIVLHELRHTFASLSNEAGVPEFNIGRALGHASPSTTKRIYTHLFDKTHTSAISQVAQILDSAVARRMQIIDNPIDSQIVANSFEFQEHCDIITAE